MRLMQSGTTEVYQDDLAYIHDVGFSAYALNAAPGLLEILRKYGITGGLVVDLGCGSGLWARELNYHGYEVFGVDISAAMLNIARKRVPHARFVQGSFLDVALPSCVAVTSIGECLNYLFDAKNTARGLVRLFRRVHDALVPGGVFAFDVAEPGMARDPHRGARPRRSWAAGEDWAVLVHFEGDTKKNLLTRQIISFRREGEQYRRAEETHRQQLYQGNDLARELRRVGFRVRLLRGYGKFRLPGARVVLLARKPG
jgi:SAM-dependent methyltransferase